VKIPAPSAGVIRPTAGWGKKIAPQGFQAGSMLKIEWGAKLKSEQSDYP